MKKLLMTILCCMAFGNDFAAIEPGKVYSIVLASDTTKALFVENSSLWSGSTVNLWKDTHVPAQQWEAVKSTDGNTYSFRNLCTGMYLSFTSASSLNSEICQVAAISTKTKWLLRGVDVTNNVYRLRISGYSLQANGTMDGNRPTLQNNDVSNLSQEWKFLEVTDPVTEFNGTARKEMMDAYLKQFIQVHSNSYLSFGNGGWGECEMMEVILDAYEETHDLAYKSLFEKMYAYFKQGVGDDWSGGGKNGYAWFGYDFNDDVAWMIIAAARAGHLLGDLVYIADAKRNFDLIYKRAYISPLGLLRWAQYAGVNNDGSFTINSCINGPMEVAACYIGLVLNDESYYEKARGLYTQQRARLANMDTGQVYDSFRVNSDATPNGESNSWASTYNQGTMMGAAVLLYNHYGDVQYKKDAEMIMNYTMNRLCNSNGIISVCQTVKGDLCGFKGILMRYVRRLVVDCGDSQYLSWMKANAWQSYNNRNSMGYTHSAWLTKSSETLMYGNDHYDDSPFGCSTAVSAAFNVPLNMSAESEVTEYTQEAEFATLKGSSTIFRDRYSSHGMYVGNVGFGGTVEFDYEAPKDGVYDITIYYMSENGRWMYVTTPGGNQDMIRYKLSGSSTALSQNTQVVQLKLNKGNNRILMGNMTGDCPNLDKFVITFNEVDTGIRNVVSHQKDGLSDQWYNLQGQPVDAQSKRRGIYIYRGKKIVVD